MNFLVNLKHLKTMKKCEGILPSNSRLRNNEYNGVPLRGLVVCMYMHPEVFEGLEQEEGSKSPEEWVKIAEELIEENGGKLFCMKWLQDNGYKGLMHCIRRYPDLFKHIEQDLFSDFLSFEEAREYVHTLNINTYNQWKKYCNSGKKPNNVPNFPDGVYKDKGWISWGDWLGTGRIATHLREYLSFKEAREFAIKLKLKNWEQWNKYCESPNKPVNIPTRPDLVYQNKGWIDRANWLGNINRFQSWRPFKEARKFAKSLKLKSNEEWEKYCRSKKKPNDIPFAPYQVYKGKGWLNWGDWLGYRNKIGGWKSFGEARKFVRKLKLKSRKEWEKYCKSGKKPNNIPNYPINVYEKEWRGMGDWLGKTKKNRI